MNKIYLILWSVFSTTIADCAFAQSNDINDVITAANNGVMSSLEKIPPGNEKGYGFNSRKEFEIAKTGNPYHVYTIKNNLFSDGNLQDGKNYLKPLYEWRVPITVNGQIRALLTITKVKGTWRVVNFGAAALAEDIGAVKEDSTYSSQHILLDVYQQNCYYVIQPGPNDTSSLKVLPLLSAKKIFNLENNSYSLFETLLLIKKQGLKKLKD